MNCRLIGAKCTNSFPGSTDVLYHRECAALYDIDHMLLMGDLEDSAKHQTSEKGKDTGKRKARKQRGSFKE